MTRSNPIHDSVKPIYRSRFIEYRMLQLFWKFKKVNKKVSYRKQTATSSFVCVKRYEHTSWGQPLEAPPLGSRAWPWSMDPVWNYPSPSWSPCKIRLTLCHATWARVGGPKDFGALGPASLEWAWVILKREPPHGLIYGIWSNRVSTRTEIRPRNWARRVPLFNVTQGHRKWHKSIGCLWLPIRDS